jgi:hypothetical protein
MPKIHFGQTVKTHSTTFLTLFTYTGFGIFVGHRISYCNRRRINLQVHPGNAEHYNSANLSVNFFKFIYFQKVSILIEIC